MTEIFAEGLLKGKVVLVTGRCTGLERAMGERFLSLGAKLVSGRREAVLRAAADELAGELPLPCDVRDPAQVSAMVDAAEARFGHVDVLVNNAAGNISPTERLSPRPVDAVPDTVLHGTL